MRLLIGNSKILGVTDAESNDLRLIENNPI